jgi:hypothetical protein
VIDSWIERMTDVDRSERIKKSFVDPLDDEDVTAFIRIWAKLENASWIGPGA